MMPGTVAQLPSTSAAKPAWVPTAADGMLDFANGRYWLAGQSRAVATLLGGGFDAAAISGSGMYINFDNDNRPTPIGVLLSRLLSGLAAGMTLVFDVATSSSLGGFLIYLGTAPIFGDASAWNLVTIDGSMVDEGVLNISDPVSGAGSHKIAVTFNRDVGGGDHESALCHDGNAAVTQTTPYAAWTMTDAQLGWSGFDGDGQQLFETYIRSITFYPAQLPADLPALTA